MQEKADAHSRGEETDFVCVATFLPLKSWKYLISFQLLTSKVLKQIKQSEGMVNYAVKADLPKKHFWTLSIWKDQDSMRRFVMAEPHTTAMKKFEEWAGDGSAFVEWTSSNDQINWKEALEHLQNPTFYYRKEEE